MIKINGNRIEPAEIETACKKALPFSWVCAKGFVTDKQSFVALYYTDDIDVDPAFMRQALAKLLPYYMIPAYYVKIDEIPLLPNGKLNKKALAAPDLTAYRTEYAPPENETERKLCDTFARILELDRVGANDDFYDLGGDSLRSMEVVTELEALGVEVSQIYKHRSPRKIAAALLAETEDAGKSDEHRNGNALEHDQPLNYFQIRMFDYQLYAPYTTMYNMPVCWKYAKKDIDVPRLKAVVEKVLDAHPVFRTILRYDEDFELVQHYDPELPVDVTVERMTEGRLRILLPQLVQPFHLLGEPMYRARIFETAESVYLFMDIHHIISDGTSMQVLTKDLTAAYNGEALPEDMYYLFIRDQYKLSQSYDYTQAKEYFDSIYGGKDWVTLHKPEIESRESGFDAVVMPMDIDVDALERYLKKAELSRNAFLQTVALLTLACTENAENVMLGWTYHGRDSRKKERSIGLLIKELPLGISIGELTDVRSLYQSIKSQMTMGIAHREFPYTMMDFSAAANEMLAVIDEGDLLEVQGIGGIPCEAVELPRVGLALGNLMLVMIFNQNGLNIRLSYASTRYHRSSMEAFSQTYKRIAANLVAGELTDSVRAIMIG